MRKKLNVIAMGVLASVMLASEAQASDAKFVFRMPGTKVAAAVAPTEPEELRPFALDQVQISFLRVITGDEIEVRATVKNDSDHSVSIIFHDLVLAGVHDSGSKSVYCDVIPKSTEVCTSVNTSTGVQRRTFYVETLEAPGTFLNRFSDGDTLPPDFNVQ